MEYGILLAFIGLVLGLALLAYSADHFINGSVSLAKNLNISALTIGIFVLGFGTSAPEMLVSAMSAFQGVPGLAVGNVIGSNIANVALVLAVATLISPIVVTKRVLQFETMLMIAVTFIAVILMAWDHALDSFDGVVLIITMIVVFALMYIKQSANKVQAEPSEVVADGRSMTLWKSIVVTLISLVVLIISARLLVWGAGTIARFYQVSDTIIGLTIVAIGTSLPELAAAISASMKKHADLTVGNIIGSNLFNLLVVLPLPALIGGFGLSSRLVAVDLFYMTALALIIPISVLWNKENKISRFFGVLMLTSYISYIIYLVLN